MLRPPLLSLYQPPRHLAQRQPLHVFKAGANPVSNDGLQRVRRASNAPRMRVDAPGGPHPTQDVSAQPLACGVRGFVICAEGDSFNVDQIDRGGGSGA
jgi:hypothetical protein